MQLLTDSNTKTFYKSFIDYFKELPATPLDIFPIESADFIYKPASSDSPQLVNEYLRWGPQKLVDPDMKWYGAKTLWSKQAGSVIPQRLVD